MISKLIDAAVSIFEAEFYNWAHCFSTAEVEHFEEYLSFNHHSSTENIHFKKVRSKSYIVHLGRSILN